MSNSPALAKTDAVRQRILLAAKESLLANGFASLSTRKVAEAAEAPLSQIHYHFKSKAGLILALLKQENAAALERQSAMYQADLSLSARWNQACDYLQTDIETGYVRTLQEMIAAAWADQDLAAEVRSMLTSWRALLTDVVNEGFDAFGQLGPMTAEQLASLIGALFMGIESLVLLNDPQSNADMMGGLNSIGEILSALEKGDS